MVLHYTVLFNGAFDEKCHWCCCYRRPLKWKKKKRKWKRHKSDQNQIESRLTSTDFFCHGSLINIILTKPIFAQHIRSPFTVYPDIDRCISKELCFRLPTNDTINYRFCYLKHTNILFYHAWTRCSVFPFGYCSIHLLVTKRRKLDLTPTCACNVSSINLIYLPITNN